MSDPAGSGDTEHERALMRSFELRHPLFALSLRMVRNRPWTGAVMAIAFAAASLILFEGVKLADKRFSTWTEVNYVSPWQAHDREQAMRREASSEASRVVHEDTPVTVKSGQRVTVFFERNVTGGLLWRQLPEEDESLDSGGGGPLHNLARFILPPGDQLSVFRRPDGAAAELTIKGTDYVLAHAIWAGSPVQYPGSLKAQDRQWACSDFAPANCTIYGYITKAEFDALRIPETGAPAAEPDR